MNDLSMNKGVYYDDSDAELGGSDHSNDHSHDDLQDIHDANKLEGNGKVEAEDKHWHWVGKDTKNVVLWMLIVLAMIGATAAIVLTFTVSFLNNDQKNQFESGVSAS